MESRHQVRPGQAHHPRERGSHCRIHPAGWPGPGAGEIVRTADCAGIAADLLVGVGQQAYSVIRLARGIPEEAGSGPAGILEAPGNILGQPLEDLG